MNRNELEAQMQMTTKMVEVCREKTLGKNHSSTQLTAAEQEQFKNCVIKFFQAPQYIVSTVENQMRSAGQGF